MRFWDCDMRYESQKLIDIEGFPTLFLRCLWEISAKKWEISRKR